MHKIDAALIILFGAVILTCFTLAILKLAFA